MKLIKLIITATLVFSTFSTTVCADTKFTDVNENDWYYDSVDWAEANGIVYGYTDNTFAPNDYLTRAQAVTIIRRLYDDGIKYTNTFSDVNENAWYYNAVGWALGNNIAVGYGDKFGPDDIVTREQFVTMLYRHANYFAVDTAPKMDVIEQFDDAHEVSPYSRVAMEWAYGYSIIRGRTHRILDPLGGVTRAECAAMVQRYVAAYHYRFN